MASIPSDRMMILKPDGSQKHERMFTFTSHDRMLKWTKPNKHKGKGPTELLAVRPHGTYHLQLVTEDDSRRSSRRPTTRCGSGG